MIDTKVEFSRTAGQFVQEEEPAEAYFPVQQALYVEEPAGQEYP